MTVSDVLKWIRNCIEGPGGMFDYERNEMVVWNVTWNVPREVAAAWWILGCLSNPRCEGSTEVLEAILERRRRIEAGEEVDW